MKFMKYEKLGNAPCGYQPRAIKCPYCGELIEYLYKPLECTETYDTTVVMDENKEGLVSKEELKEWLVARSIWDAIRNHECERHL